MLDRVAKDVLLCWIPWLRMYKRAGSRSKGCIDVLDPLVKDEHVLVIKECVSNRFQCYLNSTLLLSELFVLRLSSK